MVSVRFSLRTEAQGSFSTRVKLSVLVNMMDFYFKELVGCIAKMEELKMESSKGDNWLELGSGTAKAHINMCLGSMGRIVKLLKRVLAFHRKKLIKFGNSFI